jgi:hypothetical protein
LSKGDPDVIVITLDTLRADHLGGYGYPIPVSPWLDRFALRSRTFRHTVCTAVFTLPSHVSIFSGRYPFQHGVRSNHTPYRQPAPLLAEILADRGFATGAFISGYPLMNRFSGLSRGFQRYDEALGDLPSKPEFCRESNKQRRNAPRNPTLLKANVRSVVRSGMETCRKAVAWIRGVSSGSPVFLTGGFLQQARLKASSIRNRKTLIIWAR